MSQQQTCEVKTRQENALWLTGSFGHDSFISFISSFYFVNANYAIPSREKTVVSDVRGL